MFFVAVDDVALECDPVTRASQHVANRPDGIFGLGQADARLPRLMKGDACGRDVIARIVGARTSAFPLVVVEIQVRGIGNDAAACCDLQRDLVVVL